MADLEDRLRSLESCFMRGTARGSRAWGGFRVWGLWHVPIWYTLVAYVQGFHMGVSGSKRTPYEYITLWDWRFKAKGLESWCISPSNNTS